MQSLTLIKQTSVQSTVRLHLLTSKEPESSNTIVHLSNNQITA